ncbi:MAG: hypothetical protein Q8N99_06975 [Nanoarchaeota archaeon]|nr:hypothetical protein [Nanoarchaeota archaeon]
MAKLKPQKIEAYKCPKCNAFLTMTYEQAQAHVDSPVDEPFQTGFVYAIDIHEGTYLLRRVIDSRLISQEEVGEGVHGYEHRVDGYTVHRDEIIPGSEGIINTKRIREDFKKGSSRLLTTEEVARLRKVFGRRIRRTDPSLEARTK